MASNKSTFFKSLWLKPVNRWIIATLIIILLVIQWPVFFLQASDNKTGVVLYRHSLRLNDEFQVSYTHSVEKTPVVEHYRIMPDKRILLTEMVYQSYGAGLPTDKDYDYEIFEDSFRLYNINKVSSALVYRTDPQTLDLDMRLIFDDESIPFRQFSEERSSIKLEIKRNPLWLFYIKEWYNKTSS
ncbi:MAG: DUF1850 domain-containing protein [Tindallia sp. MSAO_Bac2]|nr:MAG: DUF1850 domain-containing protein [Tindallia sp. MSAO_Bac2]